MLNAIGMESSQSMDRQATGASVPTAAAPSVAIVLLHLDARDALRACVRSCAAVDYAAYDILIVENGSRTPLDAAELSALAGRPVTVIRSAVNRGFAGGTNLGIRAALSRGAERILLLNDDTEVSPGFLTALVAAIDADPQLGAVGPAICYFDEPAKVWFAGATFNVETCQVHSARADEPTAALPPALVPTDWLSGCCMLMTRAALERAGLLDERFFLYWEDADWSLRVRAAGFSTAVVPAARIYHKISVSAGGNDSPRKAYHKIRSHLAFARVHTPHLVPRLLRGLIRDIGWLLLKSRQPDRLRRARAYAAAIKDAWLGRTDRGPRWLWEPA
jgi:GT2 family glycosyltransferase